MRFFTWKMRALVGVLALGTPAGMITADDGVVEDNKHRDGNRLLLLPLTDPVERFSERRSASSASQSGETLPARLACVRVSRGLLEEYVNRDIDREQPLIDSILGTDLTGRSHTRGRTQLVLLASDAAALAEVLFEGTIESQTTGRKGPVTLQIKATTRFSARKQLLITSDGITVSPSTATAETSSETTGIETKTGGMRGRIVEQVARRRSNELRDQANTIAAEHAAQQVKRALDAQVDEAVAQSRAALARLLNARGRPAHKLGWRSTPDYVEVVLVRSGANDAEGDLAPPAIEGNPGLAARVHHSVVRRALADPGLVQTFGPFLTALNIDRRDAGSATPNKPYYFTWSPGRTWLVIDHAGPQTRLTGAVDKVSPFGSPLLNFEPNRPIADIKP